MGLGFILGEFQIWGLFRGYLVAFVFLGLVWCLFRVDLGYFWGKFQILGRFWGLLRVALFFWRGGLEFIEGWFRVYL